MNQIFSSFGIPLYVHKQLRKSCKILPNYEKRLFKVSPFGYYKEFYKETPAFFEEGVVQMSFKYSIDHFHYNSEKLLSHTQTKFSHSNQQEGSIPSNSGNIENLIKKEFYSVSLDNDKNAMNLSNALFWGWAGLFWQSPETVPRSGL